VVRPPWPHLSLGRSRQAGFDIFGQISPSGGRSYLRGSLYPPWRYFGPRWSPARRGRFPRDWR